MPEPIATWDANILLWVQENLRTPLGNLIIPIWSRLGDGGLIWIAAAVLLLCFRRTRRAGVLALGGLLLDFICINGILKHLVARPRPWLVVEGLDTILYHHDPNSFPSGHTGAAFAFAAAVYRELPRAWMGIVAVLAAVCMGWSRIYVAVHFPSDVIAGAVVGALCGLLAAWLYGRFFRARFPLDGSGERSRT